MWVLIEAVLIYIHNMRFEQKYENSQKIKLKIVIFTAVKTRCILHGRVFVMFGMDLFSLNCMVYKEDTDDLATISLFSR